jgi:acyl-[acyl carrier protein]--UDP-N-acetylglucosamine O-acyltransferase
LQRFENFVPDAQRAFESLALSSWLYHFCQAGAAVMVSAASVVAAGVPTFVVTHSVPEWVY